MQLGPIIPFEPITSTDIPQGKNWTAQVKWDGVRILTYYDGESVRLFNRRLNERTLQFPELIDIKNYCRATSVVLDGEVIAMEKGKPSFHKIMTRDSVRSIEKVARARRETPIIYMIFDVLYHGGQWVNNLALSERLVMLDEIIEPQEYVQIVEGFGDGETLFEAVKAQGMEGIVAKNLESKYTFKGKDGRWQKRKNYRDLIAVVGGVTVRGNTVNAILLGLYDQAGKLWYIGHAGTGKLTSSDWAGLTEWVQPLIIKERPFINKPERIKEAIWVRPVLTAKIKFMEWTSNQTLRQPSIQTFVEVPPLECVFE